MATDPLLSVRRAALAAGTYRPVLAGPLGEAAARWLDAPRTSCPHLPGADARYGWAWLSTPGWLACGPCFQVADDLEGEHAPCVGCGAPHAPIAVLVPLPDWVNGCGWACPACADRCCPTAVPAPPTTEGDPQ